MLSSENIVLMVNFYQLRSGFACSFCGCPMVEDIQCRVLAGKSAYEVEGEVLERFVCLLLFSTLDSTTLDDVDISTS